MKFVGIRELRNITSKLMEELNKEKEIVITSNGKPMAILSSVNEENLESKLAAFRKIRAIEAVTAMQMKSAATEDLRLSDDEIQNEIKAVRKKRNK